MSVIDTVKNIFQRTDTITIPTPKPSPPTSARHLAGKRARVSIDNQEDIPFLAALFIAPPPDYESDWRLGELDTETLSRISPTDLMERMADLSPEISRAIWDFLRFINPGHECKVYKLNSKVENKAGQAVVNGILELLKDLYGSPKVTFGRLIMGGLMRGAFMGEIVLDKNGREVVDFATPDPASARFRKVKDDQRGTIWQLGQWQGTEFRPIDSPAVKYIPIDPFPGKPYGRSPISPALFLSLFLIGLLHDLRRVIAQQGYPRIDISIDLEKLATSMPSDVASNPEEFKRWVNEIVDQIGTVYAGLLPEDTYVHTSVVNVNRPIGTVNADSLGAIDGLLMGLERMTIRALKTMPFLMGTSESTTETQSNRQWEAYVQTIKSLQHLIESLIESLLKVALQAQGIQADIEFRFAEVRASEMLRDAQAEAAQYANLVTAYNQGWASQEEVAEAAVGHAPDVPAPRASASPMFGAPEPEPDVIPDEVDEELANEEGEERYILNRIEGRRLLLEVRAARLEVARAVETVSRNGHKVEA